MRISDILQQKAIIENWAADDELRALNEKIAIIKSNINDIDISALQGDLDLVDKSINDMVHDINSLQGNIQRIKDNASDLMQAMAPEPLAESYDMYDERKNWFNAEKAAEVRTYDPFRDDNEFRHKFNTLVTKFVSWRYPTLYIRPNSTHFMDALKASDILYIMEQCDVTDWLKENTEDMFYKKSIRFKEFHENGRTFIEHIYPQGQMGLILMENFINFKPLEVVKQYLNESMELLRPGGYLLFTYNNCDLASGARNFEKGLYCFTPGRMLRLICEATGFEVIDDTTSDRVNWFALRKPGELTSLKGGKCLGQIMVEK